jgi:hypothetical protein
MRSLLLIASLLALCVFANAQDNKWSVSLNSGIIILMDAGNLSNFTPYFDGYGKVPNKIPGFEADSTNTGISPNAGSASMLPFSIKLSKSVSKKLALGLQYLYYHRYGQGFYSESSGYIDFEKKHPVSSKAYLNKRIHSFFLSAAYVFSNTNKKLTWHLVPMIGTTYWHIQNGYYLSSEVEKVGYFNGIAEDYIERSDWAFTYGLGLGCTYALSLHWGISLDAQLTTFNLKPESATRYSYKIDGVELVETLTIREQQFIFTDQYADRPDEPNAPQVLPAENYRYFVPQFTIGVGYSF